MINIKKFKKIILFFAMCMVFFPAKSFSASLQPSKVVVFSAKLPRILSFDEKIVKYKLSDEKSFKSEILADISNSKRDLLLKPLSLKDGTLTVWTNSQIYNFYLQFTPDNSPILSQVNSGIDDFELDLPPQIKKQQPVTLRE
jgi:hypothetical protein